VELSDLDGFSGAAPLFPLPNVVFFPQTVLPLHIFEPRYREMTQDVLAGERLIAMGLLKPGWEGDYHGAPPVHPVVGLGRVVQEARLPDGRFNIVLYGLRRARVVEESRGRAYRVARLELLEDKTPADPGLEQVRLGLLAVYGTLMRKVLKTSAKPEPDMPLGLLCDLLAAYIDLGSERKQSILEALDVAERSRLLVEALQRTTAAAPAAPARWPPSPSSN
jgi:hypothetical protein